MAVTAPPPLVAAARPPGDDLGEEVRLRPRHLQRADALVVAGTAVSAFCATWLVFHRLVPLEGTFGFVTAWYASFVGLTWLVVRTRSAGPVARDQLASVLITTAGMGLVIPLALILSYVVWKGVPALRPQFFVETQATVGPLSPATDGGGAHAIVGTLVQVGIAALIAVPLGVMTAVFLNEVGGRVARPVRMIVDAMSAVPSIVAGLFIYAVYVLRFGGERSGFAAALALFVLMLPTVTRTSEVVLRLVPGGLREASLALGASDWRTVRTVVLPTARSGLVTAVLLGVGRVVGETAPLLLTTGGAAVMVLSPFGEPQEALPRLVYNLIQFAEPAQQQRAWTGALVLILLVLILFALARAASARPPGRQPRFRPLLRLRGRRVAAR